MENETEMLEELNSDLYSLSDWEQTFVESVSNQKYDFTSNQCTKIREIYEEHIEKQSRKW